MDRATLHRRWLGLSCAVGTVAIIVKEAAEWHAGDPGALDVRSSTLAALLFVAAVQLFSHAPAAQQLTCKPVLAVDLDECCCAYLKSFIRYSNSKHRTKLVIDDFTTYKFWEVPKAELPTREAAVDRVYAFHGSRFFDEIEPFHDAKVALDHLKEKFDLHVVTSRQADIEVQTRAFVAKHFPGCFVGLHFGNHFGKGGAKVSKPDLCKQIGAVALIDDSIDYARECADAGLPVFLFGQYPWNSSLEPLSSLITRVHTWRMVAQIVTPEALGVIAG
jgi:uncharacterized HAD superfamily protein